MQKTTSSVEAQTPKTYAEKKNASKNTDYKDTDKDKFTKSKIQRKRRSLKRILDKKQQKDNLQVVACWSCATRSKATKAMLGNTLTLAIP